MKDLMTQIPAAFRMLIYYLTGLIILCTDLQYQMDSFNKIAYFHRTKKMQME